MFASDGGTELVIPLMCKARIESPISLNTVGVKHQRQLLGSQLQVFLQGTGLYQLFFSGTGYQDFFRSLCLTWMHISACIDIYSSWQSLFLYSCIFLRDLGCGINRVVAIMYTGCSLIVLSLGLQEG